MRILIGLFQIDIFLDIISKGDVMKEELRKYIKENFIIVKSRSSVMAKCQSAHFSCDEEYSVGNGMSINDYINNNKDLNSFQTLLFKMIDERNLKDSDVYNKVHLDRRLFSKIRSDNNYHPSKETVILLGLSLELKEKEFIKLLESASYSLPKNNYFDLIIRFCILNEIYQLSTVNDLLSEYHCKLLNC